MPILYLFPFHSDPMQLKKAFKWSKNVYYSLENEKFKSLHSFSTATNKVNILLEDTQFNGLFKALLRICPEIVGFKRN